MRVVLIVIGALALFACSNASQEVSNTTAEQTADINGTWRFVEYLAPSQCIPSPNENLSTMTITQTGDQLLVVSDGNLFVGKISGNRASWSGQTYNNFVGSNHSILNLRLDFKDGILEGSSVWQAHNLGNTGSNITPCNGKSQLKAAKLDSNLANGLNTINNAALAPPVPDNVSAENLAQNIIQIKWQMSESTASLFFIQRKDSTQNDFVEIAQVPGYFHHYVDETALSQTAYQYRVVANNTAGNSSPSSPASITSMADPANSPSAPTALTATSISDKQILLKWQETTNSEKEFRIERIAANEVNYQLVARLGRDATGYVDSNLQATTEYTYRVYANNDQGDSGTSNTASATTQQVPVTPPDAPTNFSAVYDSDSETVVLNWTDNANNESGFRLIRKNNTTQEETTIPIISDQESFTDSALLSGLTNYTYTLVAFNGNLDSQSVTDSVSTPDLVTLTAIASAGFISGPSLMCTLGTCQKNYTRNRVIILSKYEYKLPPGYIGIPYATYWIGCDNILGKTCEQTMSDNKTIQTGLAQ